MGSLSGMAGIVGLRRAKKKGPAKLTDPFDLSET
jgi:hypothetical protein